MQVCTQLAIVQSIFQHPSKNSLFLCLRTHLSYCRWSSRYNHLPETTWLDKQDYCSQLTQPGWFYRVYSLITFRVRKIRPSSVASITKSQNQTWLRCSAQRLITNMDVVFRFWGCSHGMKILGLAYFSKKKVMFDYIDLPLENWSK